MGRKSVIVIGQTYYGWKVIGEGFRVPTTTNLVYPCECTYTLEKADIRSDYLRQGHVDLMRDYIQHLEARIAAGNVPEVDPPTPPEAKRTYAQLKHDNECLIEKNAQLSTENQLLKEEKRDIVAKAAAFRKDILYYLWDLTSDIADRITIQIKKLEQAGGQGERVAAQMKLRDFYRKAGSQFFYSEASFIANRNMWKSDKSQAMQHASNKEIINQEHQRDQRGIKELK